MTLLKDVDMKFILEAPNVIGMVPVTMGLQSSRMESTVLSRFIDASCGHTHVKVERTAPNPAPSDPPETKLDIKGSKSKSGTQKIVRINKKSHKTMKCPFCESVLNTRAIHGHCRHKHEKYDPGYVTRYIKGISAAAAGPAPAVAADLPEGPGGPSSDPKETLNSISPNTLVTGMHVRQVRPDRGNKVLGYGVVTARIGGLLEVNYGNGKKYKIPADCLEIVTGPEKIVPRVS
jgi:hypothetical protein